VEAANLKYLPKHEHFLKNFHYFGIKYPDEKKCINDITPFMVLLKNQGAYTE